MGLDQNAFSVSQEDPKEYHEIAYWRKHPNLQGWMEKLWNEKGNNGTFNVAEVELTKEDLLRLREDVIKNALAKLDTKGFFFGAPSDEYYKDADLEFIDKALDEISEGRKVVYSSWW